MTDNIKKIKTNLLLSAFEILPYETLNNSLLTKACHNINIDENYAQLIYPNGLCQLFEDFRDFIDNQLLIKITEELDNKAGITGRIHQSVMLRLKILANYKLAYARIMIYFMLPWNIGKTHSYNWPTLDIIWCKAGYDTSTDFNYYSKRLLLHSAYIATIKFWLKDNSTGNMETSDFLNKRLNLIVKRGRHLQTTKEYLKEIKKYIFCQIDKKENGN